VLVVLLMDSCHDSDIDHTNRKDKGTDGLLVIFDRLLACPTLRGHIKDEYDPENSWLISGNGAQFAQLKCWKEAKKYPKDWEKQLGDHFVDDLLLNKVWRWYQCRDCEEVI
jgi:hypothetical protein